MSPSLTEFSLAKLRAALIKVELHVVIVVKKVTSRDDDFACCSTN